MRGYGEKLSMVDSCLDPERGVETTRRWRRRAADVAAAVAGFLLLTGCGPEHSRPVPPTAPAATRDPVRIVPFQAIGAARIGMKRAPVGRAYGSAVKIERSRRWFPAGTRYYGEVLERRTYRAAGGTLTAWFVRDRVKVLATTSPRYRLPDGSHVGSRIPLRRCPGGGATSACWHRYGYDDCTGLLIDSQRPTATSYIAIARPAGLVRYRPYAVTRIGFGEDDVILLCF